MRWRVFPQKTSSRGFSHRLHVRLFWYGFVRPAAAALITPIKTIHHASKKGAEKQCRRQQRWRSQIIALYSCRCRRARFIHYSTRGRAIAMAVAAAATTSKTSASPPHDHTPPSEEILCLYLSPISHQREADVASLRPNAFSEATVWKITRRTKYE